MMDMFKRIDLQLFADPGNEGDEKKGDEKKVEDDNDSGKKSDEGKAEEKKTEDVKTYSIAEAERLASEREERARKAALKSYFEQQGYSQDDVEKMLVEDKERREKAKTELEREKEARELAEKERNRALSEANARVARTEFKIAAQNAGIPAERLEAAVKLADLSSIAPDEKTGEIPIEIVKNVVDKTLEANPFLKAEDQKPSNMGGAGGNTGSGSKGKPSVAEIGKMTMEEYIKFRRKEGNDK